MAYGGGIILATGLKPMTGTDYPLMDAHAVYVDDDTRLDEALANIEQGGLKQIVEVTWAELVEMRDNEELTPGQQYRITDYVTTTDAYNWLGVFFYRSAEHRYDLIVIANSTSSLCEKARAVLHSGDLPDDIVETDETTGETTRTKYFEECDLASWEIWYSLDNDKSRFSWAMDTAYINIRGMQSNAIYLRSEEDDVTSGSYPYCWKLSGGTTKVYTDTETPVIGSPVKTSSSGAGSYSVAWAGSAGKGVVYRMIDEFRNDAPYDFKNILFSRWSVTDIKGIYNGLLNITEAARAHLMARFSSGQNGGLYASSTNDGMRIFGTQISVSTTTYSWNYTFGGIEDYSLDVIYAVNNNTILPTHTDILITTTAYRLNNIVIYGVVAYSNTFGRNVHDITIVGVKKGSSSDGYFYAYFYNNTFGPECKGILAGAAFNNSSLGEECNHILMGDSFFNSHIDDGCSYLVMGMDADSISIGQGSAYISLGNTSTYSSFGHLNFGIVLGDGCIINHIGDDCNNIVMGHNCRENDIGTGCHEIYFGSIPSSEELTSKPSSFEATSSYEEGDMVFYKGVLYKCKNSHTGEWNKDDFEAVTYPSSVPSTFSSTATYSAGDIVRYGFQNFVCIAENGHTGSWNASDFYFLPCLFYALDEYRHIKVDAGNTAINLVKTADEDSIFKNVHLVSGMNSSDDTYIRILNGTYNQSFHTLYKPKDSIEIEVC